MAGNDVMQCCIFMAVNMLVMSCTHKSICLKFISSQKNLYVVGFFFLKTKSVLLFTNILHVSFLKDTNLEINILGKNNLRPVDYNDTFTLRCVS